MRMYMSVFRIRFIGNMQYRAALVGEIIARFGWAIMEVLAFTAFFRTSPGSFPMPYQQTITYLWLQEIFRALFTVVFMDGDIYSAIGTGGIAYELVRPISIYGRWFCQSAANRLAFTVLNCLPALAIAFIVPQPYRMTLPPDAGAFIMFALSVALAVGVVVALSMLMYISLFYTLSQRGVRIMVTAVTTFLSGGVIPLPFFPDNVRRVVQLLPFAAMRDVPLRIYCGNIEGAAAMSAVALQLCWFAALVVIGRLTIRRALGKVIVQGG